MAENALSLFSTEELKNLFVTETRKFTHGIDSGLLFDSLKEIRGKLRKIEIELHKRGVDL